jgi:hypothetical protein
MTNQAANPPGESRRLADRWRNTRAVLVDGARAAGAVVAGIVVACVIGYLWPRQSGSTAIGIAAVVLQLLGLASVALGMRQMRRRFKRPSWFRRLWVALQGPRDVTVQISGVGSASGTGKVSGVGALANPTIEARVAALEAALPKLRSDLTAKMQTITTSVDAVKHEIQREAATRASAITDVLRQLEDVSAGGLYLESIGLWWLVVAAVFSSVPNELAALLGPF